MAWQDNKVWYDRGGSTEISLPNAAIPESKKDEAWMKQTLDAFEGIGINQFYDNLKLQDYYRMVDGDMSHQELKDAIPHLKDVGDLFDKADLPVDIRHYDLLGILVRTMTGEFSSHGDKFSVTNDDDFASNQYQRDKKELLLKHVNERLEQELQTKLLSRGIQPDITKTGITDPQQIQEYQNQVQQAKQELTPPEIEQHMRRDWKTTLQVWGQHTLKQDTNRFNLEEVRRNQFRDYLISGRVFREHTAKFRHYSVKPWNPIQTFFSKDIDTRHTEKGDYVGRIHYYTPAQIIAEHGSKMSASDKEDLLNCGLTGGRNGGSSNSTTGGFMSHVKTNFLDYGLESIPNSHDHSFLVDLENELGIPMGETTLIGKDGKNRTVPAYLPRRHSDGAMNHRRNIYDKVRTDLHVREDLIQTTEVYWKDFQKIGYLTYESESGALISEIVTEDILSDFLKERGIKKTKLKTFEEAVTDPEPNTLVWDYKPQVRYGVKVQLPTKDLYIDGEPLEYQIKADGNIFDVLLPVTGYVGIGLGKLTDNYQRGYNLAMNELRNLMEKELGIFFLMDINLLPSEYKNWGNTENALYHLTTLAKDVGVFPIDSRRQNIQDAGGFNQFTRQDITFGNQIQTRASMAEMYKQQAFQQIGITPQRTGAASKYETAEGVKVSQDASYSQTEEWFENFSSFEKASLEVHLSVAQYAKSHDGDISVFYTSSDLEQVAIPMMEPNILMRNLGIHILSSSKARKQLETTKAYYLNNNTMGFDELAIAKLISSDSVTEIIQEARAERIRQEKIRAQSQQDTLQQIQAKAEADEKSKQSERQFKSRENQLDRDNRIEVERIEALGRAADKDSNQTGIDIITREADQALSAQKINNDYKLKSRDLDIKEIQSNSELDMKMQKLRLESEKTKLKLKELENNRYIATINKN